MKQTTTPVKALQYDNEFYSIKQVAEQHQIKYETLVSRIRRGNSSIITINNKQFKVIR